MRTLIPYSQYRFAIRANRLGTIHAALRSGRTPHDHVHIDHKKLFRMYSPATADELHRWSQYLKRNYPEFRHDNPEPSS